MTETPANEPISASDVIWQVSFYMEYRPESMLPQHFRAEVAKGTPEGDAWRYEHDGIATFEGPAIIPPRHGGQLLQYLLYHLTEIKEFLVQEHVNRVMNGAELVMDPKVTVPRDHLDVVD